MKFITSSHHGGEARIKEQFILEICSLIQQTDATKGKKSVTDFRDSIPKDLIKLGWSDNVCLDSKISKINITSVREKVGLCVQTGNVSRIYADLLKLQTLYVRNTIKAAIVIVPTAPTSRIIGVNVASYDRLEKEMELFDPVITVPLVVIGFEV